MNLEWVECEGDVWCSLSRLRLLYIETVGVYVIWRPGGLLFQKTIYVGQGDIRDRIQAHRKDPRIQQFEGTPELLVTWATVSVQSARDGIERFLADSLRPQVGVQHPNVAPVPVNLPAW